MKIRLNKGRPERKTVAHVEMRVAQAEVPRRMVDLLYLLIRSIWR